MDGPPNDVDWKNAEMFASFLKPFYDITLRVCCSNSPTVHHAFMDVFKIYNLLHKVNGIANLNSTRESMKSKYNKYWGDLDKVNKYFFLAIIIDPRHKLDKVRDFFEVICRTDEDVEKNIQSVKNVLSRLYTIYNVRVPILISQSEGTSNVVGTNTSTNDLSSCTDLEELLLEKSRIRQAKLNDFISNDLDRYLTDKIEIVQSEFFNILMWWKVIGAPKYPTLALLARDILAIPVSTISSESCFSTSGRVIDSYRSSLSPKMVEALICTQSWLRGDHIALDHIPSEYEIQLCEDAEKDYAKDS
jgi:hypothetical protein